MPESAYRLKPNDEVVPVAWPEDRWPEEQEVKRIVFEKVKELKNLDPQNRLVWIVQYVGGFCSAYLQSRQLHQCTIDEYITALRQYEKDLIAEIERIRAAQ